MFRYVCRATAGAMLFIFLVVGSLPTPLAHAAETFPTQTILTPPNGGDPSLFGNAVVSDGNTALVSAPGLNGRRGGVYVYVRTQGHWTQQALLTPDPSAPTGIIYQALAIRGDTILVGPSDLNAGLVYVYVRSGTQWTQQAVLRPEDESAQRGFGERVAIAGDTAYISVLAKKAIDVYVRTGTTWVRQASIQANPPVDGFGLSFAVDGTTLLVSAQATNGVYVFGRSGATWQHQAVIAEPKDATFGLDLALEGDTAVLGAATPAGAEADIYVHSGANWTLQQSLNFSQHEAMYFITLALHKETLIIGSFTLRDSRLDSSISFASYVYVRTGTQWSKQATLAAVTSSTTDIFGPEAVALAGDTALIGIDAVDGGGGQALVFTRSGTTWTQAQTLVPAEQVSFIGHFGESLALSGDTLLVGAPGYSSGVEGARAMDAAFIYVRSGTTWSQQALLTPPDAFASGYYGTAVALSGDTALVAARSSTERAQVVFVYVRTGTAWTQQAILRPDPAEDTDQFGERIALQGDTAVISSHRQKTGGTVCTYIRTGATWTRQSALVLTGSDYTYVDAMAVSGDTLAINTARDSLSSQSAVLIYVRQGHNWQQQARLTGMDATAIALDQDRLIVLGMHYQHTDNSSTLVGRSLYTYSRQGVTWTQEDTLALSRVAGGQVALQGDTALVSENVEKQGDYEATRVRVYTRSGVGWRERGPLDAGANTSLGRAIALDGTTAVARGSYYDRAVYVFDTQQSQGDIPVPPTPTPALPGLPNTGHAFVSDADRASGTDGRGLILAALLCSGVLYAGMALSRRLSRKWRV